MLFYTPVLEIETELPISPDMLSSILCWGTLVKLHNGTIAIPEQAAIAKTANGRTILYELLLNINDKN